MVKRSLVVVVVNPYSLHSATALKTFDQREESRSSDLLLTPTALASHPDILKVAIILTT